MLARIFGHIQNLHKSLADGALNDMEAEQRTRNLAHELERYIDFLPLEIHFSVENFKNHAALGLGRAFVALHLGYRHYATLLYFPYLDHQEREPRIERYIQVAVNTIPHSSAIYSDCLMR